ncbi:MAG: hypothetical protein ACLUEC_10555 [Coprococcus sp.]
MLIKDGYYVSERISKEFPVSKIDGNTLYMPFNVTETEEGYEFEEYRINLPIKSDIDTEILKKIVESVPDMQRFVGNTLQETLGIGDMQQCKAAIGFAKETAMKEDNKTLGIAFSFAFEVWKNGIYKTGDVRLDPETGNPCECIQDHDSIKNTNWTIKERTLWKPWHSRSPEFALQWEKPTGAHDIYKTGEYMVHTDGKIYLCKQDTNFSPEEYAQAWQLAE